MQVLIEWNAGGAEKSQSQVQTTFTKLISFYCAQQSFDFELQKVGETLSQTLSQCLKILSCRSSVSNFDSKITDLGL